MKREKFYDVLAIKSTPRIVKNVILGNGEDHAKKGEAKFNKSRWCARSIKILLQVRNFCVKMKWKINRFVDGQLSVVTHKRPALIKPIKIPFGPLKIPTSEQHDISF